MLSRGRLVRRQFVSVKTALYDLIDKADTSDPLYKRATTSPKTPLKDHIS